MTDRSRILQHFRFGPLETSQRVHDRDTLPRPLCGGRAWSAGRRDASEALWAWQTVLFAGRHAGHPPGSFEEAARRVEAGEPLTLVPDDVRSAAYRACGEHDLPLALLAQQVRGAARVQPPVRFAEQGERRDMLEALVVPHGRLLANLAGARLRMQQALIDALTLGFFYTGRLVELPRDVAADRLFLPTDMLDQYDVSLGQLRRGDVNENVRRMLWKETVRARDLLARGRALLDELPWRLRYGMKRWWLGALEMLNEIEAREYDVWNQPPHLSRLHRAQVELQAFFGRAGKRTR